MHIDEGSNLDAARGLLAQLRESKGFEAAAVEAAIHSLGSWVGDVEKATEGAEVDEEALAVSVQAVRQAAAGLKVAHCGPLSASLMLMVPWCLGVRCGRDWRPYRGSDHCQSRGYRRYEDGAQGSHCARGGGGAPGQAGGAAQEAPAHRRGLARSQAASPQAARAPHSSGRARQNEIGSPGWGKRSSRWKTRAGWPGVLRGPHLFDCETPTQVTTAKITKTTNRIKIVYI